VLISWNCFTYSSVRSLGEGLPAGVSAPFSTATGTPSAWRVNGSDPTEPRIHCGAYLAAAATASSGAVAEVTPKKITTCAPPAASWETQVWAVAALWVPEVYGIETSNFTPASLKAPSASIPNSSFW